MRSQHLRTRHIIWRRVGLVLFLIALLVWISLILNAYWRGLGLPVDYPLSPSKLAAIVRIVEETPAAGRGDLVAALNSADVHVSILTPGDTASGSDVAPVRRQREDLLASYRESLGGSPLDIFSFEEPFKKTDLLHTPWRRQIGIEFRIALTDGSRLVLRNFAPTGVGRWGIPVGMLAGFVAAIMALLVVAIMYRELTALTQLARAVDTIELNGSAVHLPDVGKKSPEMRSLVDAFDRLQGRLSEVLKSRFILIAGISHDLRTFATRLRLRVHAIPDATQREQAAIDIEDMIALLDDALLATQVETDNAPDELLDLAEMARAEVEDRRAAGHAVSLAGARVAGEVLVLANRLALRRILNNLIENALRYGEQARVSLATDDGNVLVRVEDDGPGISMHMKDAVMEPFTRGETSRNRSTGGAGLGLAIARNLVEAQGGSLEIRTTEQGSPFIGFTLPLFHAEQD